MTELATIPKNAREEIRVSVDDFRGLRLVNIRVWFGEGDDKRPGKQGIALRLDLLPALLDALKTGRRGAGRGRGMTTLQIARLRRLWGLSGAVAGILAPLAYGEARE